MTTGWDPPDDRPRSRRYNAMRGGLFAVTGLIAAGIAFLVFVLLGSGW
jgi:hypothetical protein